MRLWSLAGRVYNEAIFQGQVTAAGSNTARLTEKLKSDSGYVAKQGRTIQILGSFYLLTVASLSVISFIGLRNAAPSAWNLLVASGSVSMQLIIQSGYLIMLTIIATAEILAPDLYRWPASLPLSKSELGALKLLSLAREFMLPLGVIVVATPAVVGFAGGSLPGAVVGLVVSVIHAALTLGLLVILSWKMRRVLRSSDTEDRGARSLVSSRWSSTASERCSSCSSCSSGRTRSPGSSTPRGSPGTRASSPCVSCPSSRFPQLRHYC